MLKRFISGCGVLVTVLVLGLTVGSSCSVSQDRAFAKQKKQNAVHKAAMNRDPEACKNYDVGAIRGSFNRNKYRLDQN